MIKQTNPNNPYNRTSTKSINVLMPSQPSTQPENEANLSQPKNAFLNENTLTILKAPSKELPEESLSEPTSLKPDVQTADLQPTPIIHPQNTAGLRSTLKSFACLLVLIIALFITSCTEHHEPLNTQMKVGDILCTDGQTMDYRQYVNSGLQAIGVVFYVNHDLTIVGKGYAVHLRDLPPTAFADTLGIEQGTSKNVYDFSGNQNTYSLQSHTSCSSPMAQAVFDMWQYGQSAFIPSLGQYMLLYQTKEVVNYYLGKCGGDPIDDAADRCWYWTSTEVEGQSKDKAWLFSLCNGTYQETPKDQAHKSRPIITIY